MKDIKTLVNTATTPGFHMGEVSTDVYAKTRSSDLTNNQKQAIKYFFGRLQRVYQAEYRRQLPDESTQRACKQEFSHLVMNIPLETMDKGFDALHLELANYESEYRFMKLDPVIELIRTGGNLTGSQAGAYKVFKKALPMSEQHKNKRKNRGIEGCKSLMSIFDESPEETKGKLDGI